MLVGLAAAGLLLAGCGGGSADGGDASAAGSESPTGSAESSATVASVLAELEGLTVEERRARLIELSKAEGQEVTVYTSLPSENMDELAEVFEADTGVRVLTYRAGAEDIRTRVLQENQAGRLSADVLAIGDSRLIPIRDEGILAPYSSPIQEGLIDGSVNEFWTLYRFNLYAVAWNTDLVAPEEVPANYSDLADPKWAGRMTLESSDYDWFFSVSNYLRDEVGYTDEQVEEYWNTLAQNADFNKGHTSTRQLLIAGKYALFASDFSYGIARAEADGAPVAWLPPVEPLFATPEAVAAVAETERPASTILFMDWLIGEGMVILDEQLIDVTRADLLEISDLDIRFIDAEQWFIQEPAVMEKYDALSGAGS